MPKISGYLKDGAGLPVANCKIILHALKTSSVVLKEVKSFITTKEGYYEIDAQVGQYDVILLMTGASPQKVGQIQVYIDSVDGTLNDYLLNPGENEVTPEWLTQAMQARADAQQAEKNAANYASNANSAADKAKQSAQETIYQTTDMLRNTVKNQGERHQNIEGVINAQEVQDNGNRVYSPSNKPNPKTINTVALTGEVSQEIEGSINIKSQLLENGQRVYSPNNKPTSNDVGALPTTGGILTNDLTIKKNGGSLHLRNNINAGMTFRAEPSGNVSFNVFDGSAYSVKYYYEKSNNQIKFLNLDSVVIDNLPVLKQGDALPFGGVLGTKNIDNLKGDSYGVYQQLTNSAAADSNSGTYPINSAGSLSVYKTAIGQGGNNFCAVQTYMTYSAKRMFFRILNINLDLNAPWSDWSEFITTANSVIDSNGFYKKASPILRLFANENIEEMDGCIKSGCGLVNSEALGALAKRIDVGHYEIHGSYGFATSGWYIETPQDANGNKKIFVEYYVDETNIITIKTYENCFENGKFVAGQAVDIPYARWIDVRLSMSSNQS